ncbi:hypothetical protein METBIDRAFT_40820 [Metschnikowia bicuspidata var. bicuspidata NRRL YB-4993]|uniref:Uncharacterized protein n=1 Tax=Metschnikowia bicuspidata var. bicuspidata NRRL YB-4993 TaxID=869754 RepID=A0A1A0HBG6_9ASCO|nr:hypothetical protein METBIDRAFT_40820 [Metschnikowia bicuspidata var. bicuspidata NRRL YB-4993]OBA21479.1 hypothetical protein METBIDRAFT_40820 [Metschnikowia bicuspidata var. bicuspidata NRRL YB-4993]
MSDWAAKLLQKPSTGTGAGPANSGLASNGKFPLVLQPNQTVKLPAPKTATQETPQKNGRALPEPFNGADVLAWMGTRFAADLEDAQADKTGEYAVVYRSLESSSSWKTTGPGYGRKCTKEDDRYDLLQELNRTLQPKPRRC